MTITKEDIYAALARLTEAFPQTFVLEKYRPHRPLKIGIAADIPARCPELERGVLSVALSVYTRRVMYLQSLVAGAARIDLDGKAAGEVTVRDAEYAAAKLAGILASREARRTAAVQANKSAARAARQTAATADREKRQAHPFSSLNQFETGDPVAAPAPAATVLKQRPVLRLPAFRRAAQ
jgi:sRNA-binding protein